MKKIYLKILGNIFCLSDSIGEGMYKLSQKIEINKQLFIRKLFNGYSGIPQKYEDDFVANVL